MNKNTRPQSDGQKPQRRQPTESAPGQVAMQQPKLIILDEPTRGIDVGAKSEIEMLIQDLTAQGISILMISSEMEELIRSCDRMAVLRDGVKVGELVGEDISEKHIMKFIAGEKAEAKAEI